MRILEIQFIAFGSFTGLELDLSQGTQGLHVIYGPNEAGKSVALRALTGLFYGIPARTSDNFLHSNQNLRLGARIRRSKGEELFFLRRKGNKDTLLNQDGKPIPDASLEPFLDGAAEELFQTMFGIDHAGLIRGGEQILKGGGAVGESLFAAGMGGSNLREILRSLEDEASKLFLPRGKSQVITAAINAYREARQRSVQASLPSREWAEHDRALKEAALLKEKTDRELQAVRSERNRLDRLHRALPWIAERNELVAKLHAMGEVKILPAAFGKRRRDSLQQLQNGKAMETDAVAALARIRHKSESLIIPEALLQQDETIVNLHQRLGSHRKAYRDLPRLQGEKLQLTGDGEAIIKELRPDISLEQAEVLRLTTARRARIRELGNQYQALQERTARSAREVTHLQTKLAARREKLNKQEAPRDANKLRLAVSRAQKHGDLEDNLNAALAEMKTDKKAAELELGRLGLWSGALDAIEQLSLPSVETIERFEAGFNALEREQLNVQDRSRQIEASQAALELQIKELRLAGSVPSEEDLEAARRKRDEGWGLVLRAWLEGDKNSEESRAYDPQEALPRAYEKAVARADQLSDRLRREADRVARQANLIAQEEKYREQLRACEHEKTEIQQQLDELRKQWGELWRPSGIVPLFPKEMRSWLLRQERLVQRAVSLRAARGNLELLQQRARELRLALSACLVELGEPGAFPGETLDALLHRGLAVIGAVEDAGRAHRDLQKEIAQLEEDLAAALRDRDESLADFALWRTQWSVAIADLGLPEGASANEANGVLDRIEDLFKKLDKVVSLNHRIAGIVRDGEEFERDVGALVERVAPDLLEVPAEQAVVELNLRRAKALEDSATLAELRGQQAEKEDALRKAHSMIRNGELQLRELCREADCYEFAELEEVEGRSAQALETRKEIEVIERQLLDFCGSSSLEELIRDAGEVDADALPGRIAFLSEQVEETEEKRSELLESIGREKSVLDRMDGSAEAAEAAERAQGFLAQVREGANRYLQLRLASAILHREMERYRAENQDPLLRRASELFSRLTLGSFAGLRADFNEADEPILTGVRSRGEQVPVQGMSEGTRDQLYLALRLASLEKYLEHNEPMPLIVDDILVNFDDRRAEATLKLLDELSNKTQILFFTHHAHLVDLARSCPAMDGLHLHSLTPRSPR